MNKKLKILELLEKNSLVFNNLDKLFLFLSDGLNCDVEEVKKIFYSLLSNGDIYEIRKNKLQNIDFIRSLFQKLRDAVQEILNIIENKIA